MQYLSITNHAIINCTIPNDLAHLTFEVQLTYIAYEIHSERNQCFISFGIFIIFIACMIYSSNVDILDFLLLMAVLVSISLRHYSPLAFLQKFASPILRRKMKHKSSTN